MHYIAHIWIDNKVTIVIARSRQEYTKKIVELRELGGQVLDDKVRDNELGSVIVC